MRQISVGYPLITSDLPAYDLPCSALHLFRLIAYRGACALPLLVPMAKCVAQFVNGSRFEFRYSALIKHAEHLTIWSNVAQIGQMRLTLTFGS